MIRKTSKFLLRIGAGVITGFVVLLALGFWRLSQGPVPLDVVLPYLEDGLAAGDDSVKFVAREVTLNWAGWDRTLEVRVGALEAISPGGETLATVPHAAVRLSIIALLSGEIAPTAIEIEKLQLNVVLDEEGRLDLGADEPEDGGGGEILALLIDQLLTRDGRVTAVRRLERVVVTQAEIEFEDQRRGLKWRAPNAEIVLERDDEGVLGEAAIVFLAEGRSAEFNVRALFSRRDRSIAIAVNFDGLRPAAFATLDPAVAILSEIDLAFGGTVDARISPRGAIQSMTINVASGPGRIGSLGIFTDGHDVRRSAFRGEVNAADGTVRVDSMTIDFGEVVLDASAEGAIAAGNVSLAARISVPRMAASELERFWPPEMSPGGRAWAIENIEGGVAEDFALTFDVSGDLRQPESIEVANVLGAMRFADLTVHYLKPMPPVAAVAGTMRMTDAMVRFDVETGILDDINVGETTIELSNLDKATDHRADIDVGATGPIASLLRVLEHPKVGLPRDLVVKPDRVSGLAATRLIVRLPLIDALAMADIKYAASATTTNVSLKSVAAGMDLTEAALTLQLNGSEMDVRGKGRLAGHVSDIQWRENFGRAAFRRRYDVRTTLSARDLGGLTGVELSQIEGPIAVHAVLTETAASSGTLVASLNLKDAAVSVPEIGWRKEPGGDAGAKVSLDLRGGRTGDRIEVELATPDIQVQSAVMVSGDRFERAEFGRLEFGRNRLQGSIARTADGYAIAMAGASFDLAPFLADDAAVSSSTNGQNSTARKPPLGPVYDVRFDLAQVLTRRGGLARSAGEMRIQGGRVLAANLSGRVNPNVAVSVAIEPNESGRRIAVETNDAGAVLRSLGWLEGMIGGEMRLVGDFDDSQSDSPLRGTLRMGPYKLVKTPVVGEVLSVAPLTDALSAFSGSGLEFDRLLVPFLWQRGILTLNNARTAGASLGLTASGRINSTTDTIQIDGTIVPAYVLNSLLGNIPLIGPLITGGPGGGVFAINYAVEGPVVKPNVSINPLSALAPGFLRNMFGAGSGEDLIGTGEGQDPDGPPARSQPTPLLPPADQIRQ